MIPIKPQLDQIQGFTIVGLGVTTKNEDEFNPDLAKLPKLWGKFYSENYLSKIPNTTVNSPVYGVYSEYESDASGHYRVTAGLEVDGEVSDAGFSSVNVQTGNYLVFKIQGPMPQAIIQLWQEVWLYFEENPNCVRSFASDFERYIGVDQCEVFIGVRN